MTSWETTPIALGGAQPQDAARPSAFRDRPQKNDIPLACQYAYTRPRLLVASFIAALYVRLRQSRRRATSVGTLAP